MSLGMFQGGLNQKSFDRGLELRALVAAVVLADNDPRGEDRLIVAVQHQLPVGHVDPDAVRRQAPRQPAFAFEIHLKCTQAGRLGLAADRAARAEVLQGLAQGPVGRRRRRQRFDHRSGIGAAQGGVEHGCDIDRPGFQDLVFLSALGRHDPARQRVGIGQDGVRQQQFPVERRQRFRRPQDIGVKQLGVEAMIAGARDGIHE